MRTTSKPDDFYNQSVLNFIRKASVQSFKIASFRSFRICHNEIIPQVLRSQFLSLISCLSISSPVFSCHFSISVLPNQIDRLKCRNRPIFSKQIVLFIAFVLTDSCAVLINKVCQGI